MRLAAQRVASSEFTSVAEVVHWMTAMQAQDLAGALWSVGLRLPGSSLAAVEDALRGGSIVRSWPMRGTLHLVAPEDLGWMLSLTTERLVKASTARRAALELDDHQLGRAREATVAALTGGRAFRRERMHDIFAQVGISPDGQRGYQVLWYLAQTGTLCFGPPDGTQQTFALASEWIASPRELEHDEALGEFAFRYFRSHGPASIRDFAWWASLTLRDARIGVATARDRLTTLDRDGDPLYVAAGMESEPTRDGIRMLPGFDEYLLGYQDRTPQLAPEHIERILPGRNGVFRPTIVQDGEVIGTWKRALTARGVALTADLFAGSGDRVTRGVEREGQRYARFLGRKVTGRPARPPRRASEVPQVGMPAKSGRCLR